jgi:alpha-N-arabinofuranosidase
VHFDALMLPVTVSSEEYGNDKYKIPSLSVSASKNDEGVINITVANVTPGNDLETSIELKGIENYKIVKSEIITSDKMNDYNDFGNEEKVNIKEFSGTKLNGNNIQVNIPSKSVILVSLAK